MIIALWDEWTKLFFFFRNNKKLLTLSLHLLRRGLDLRYGKHFYEISLWIYFVFHIHIVQRKNASEFICMRIFVSFSIQTPM